MRMYTKDLDPDDRLLPELPEMPRETDQTIKSLRLDVEAAKAGKTWLLLPHGFRSRECGSLYPLPRHGKDLELLATIPVPRYCKDAGCSYLRRVAKKVRERHATRQFSALQIARNEQHVANAKQEFDALTKKLRAEARAAVDEVKQEAAKAVANLNDLFALGREGIEGQMKAHLSGAEWHGETIDAEGFRSCFRMVSQSIQRLGLPSDQRDKARDAVMEEFAASVKDTQEVVAMAPGSGEEKPN